MTGTSSSSASRKSSDPSSGKASAGNFLKRGGGRGVVGTQHKSVKPAATCVLDFLRGTGLDDKGRLLADIIAWGYEELERKHDWVQWVFPTDEESRFNACAPPFSVHMQEEARRDEQVLAGLAVSFHRFLDFLGLEAVEESSVGSSIRVEVRKAPHYEERFPEIWGYRNHNWLRISRVLHCLRLVGMNDEAAAFMKCLENLKNEGVPCSTSIGHWRSRAMWSAPCDDDQRS